MDEAPIEHDELVNGSTFVLGASFEVRKSIGSGERRVVEGIVSTPDEDLDGERISDTATAYNYFLRQAALNKALLDRFDWTSFEQRHGFLKWEHDGDSALACKACGKHSCFREPETIIGWPLEVEKSYAYRGRDGYPRVGTRMQAEIFPASAKNAFADGAWALLNSIEKSTSPRRLGFSIEGAYFDEHPGARKSFNAGPEKAIFVSNIVLTTKPVNQQSMAWVPVRKSLFGCTTDECCTKAVTAGSYASDPAAMSGGAALGTQSHQGVHSPFCTKRGCKDPRHKHLHDPDVRRSIITSLHQRGYSNAVITAAVRRALAA